jgi:hypothetical protein
MGSIMVGSGHDVRLVVVVQPVYPVVPTVTVH